MIKFIAAKKNQIAIILAVLLFASVSWLSLASIHQQQGSARVINYVGIVRGATQRLIKKELYGKPDDALIAKLESIVNELLTGHGSNNLVVLNNDVYLGNMNQVKKFWEQLKAEIVKVRAGADMTRLYEMSEDYFVLVDKTVSSAEDYSESQVSRSIRTLITVNGVFILLLVAGLGFYIRTAALKRRTEALQKIAYYDPLTQLPNRAHCEKQLDYLAKNSPDTPIAVFMFDMNNLKRVNDQLGHSGGDKVIADFGKIIKAEAENYGFVGRYGGDEFLGILSNGNEETAQKFLMGINEKIVAYNLLHVTELEKLSFAVGYCIEQLSDTSIVSMVEEADKRMYARKRQMKENRD